MKPLKKMPRYKIAAKSIQYEAIAKKKKKQQKKNASILAKLNDEESSNYAFN